MAGDDDTRDCLFSLLADPGAVWRQFCVVESYLPARLRPSRHIPSPHDPHTLLGLSPCPRLSYLRHDACTAAGFLVQRKRQASSGGDDAIGGGKVVASLFGVLLSPRVRTRGGNVADPGSKLCPQCGHAQAGGEFCEVCGTRLAAAAGAGFSSPAGTGGPVPPPVAGGGPAAPPPYAQYQQPVYGGGYPGSSQPGFFARLFDFSFETFITPTIIKALFILYLVVVALMTLGMVVVAFTQSVVVGLLALIIGVPIFGFIYILMGRVWLELVVIFFRIHENTDALVAQKKAGH